MLNATDIARLIIVPAECAEFGSCEHRVKVQLKDNREVSFEFCNTHIVTLIKDIADEKLNPSQDWTATKVRKHIKKYKDLTSEKYLANCTVSELLNAIFSK